MITKQDLKDYRDGKRELIEIRARLRQAELTARDSGREGDRKRAERLIRRYEKIADTRDRKQKEIEAAIEGLKRANHRRVLYYRYVLGWGRVKTALAMEVSESRVDKLTEEAVAELGGKKKNG